MVGQVKIPVTKGRFSTEQVFTVVNTLTVDCLLGSYFDISGVLHYKNVTVSLKGNVIPFRMSNSNVISSLVSHTTTSIQYTLQLLSQQNSYKSNLSVSLFTPCVLHVCIWVSVINYSQSVVLHYSYSPFGRNISDVLISCLHHGTVMVSFDCRVANTFSAGYLLLSCYFAVVWVLLQYLPAAGLGQVRHHNHPQFVNLCQVAAIWFLVELLSWCLFFHSLTTWL